MDVGSICSALLPGTIQSQRIYAHLTDYHHSDERVQNRNAQTTIPINLPPLQPRLPTPTSIARNVAHCAARLQMHHRPVVVRHIVARRAREHRRHRDRVRQQHAAAAISRQAAHRFHRLDRRLTPAKARIVLAPPCDRVAREATNRRKHHSHTTPQHKTQPPRLASLTRYCRMHGGGDSDTDTRALISGTPPASTNAPSVFSIFNRSSASHESDATSSAAFSAES